MPAIVFGSLIPAAFNIQKAFEAEAIGIALTGMLIVFFALLFICLFISVLPGLLAALETVLPTAVESPHATADPESAYPDEDAIVAGIGYILHLEMQKRG